MSETVEITGVWLRGGENKMIVSVEIAGEWIDVIEEFVPLHGNDGNVWPISHIVEVDGIRRAALAATEKQATMPRSAWDVPHDLELVLPPEAATEDHE